MSAASTTTPNSTGEKSEATLAAEEVFKLLEETKERFSKHSGAIIEGIDLLGNRVADLESWFLSELLLGLSFQYTTLLDVVCNLA